MKFSFSLLILFFIIFPTSANDYQLQEPLPQDYAEHVDNILDIADTSYTYRIYYNVEALAEASAMQDEINWRYLDQSRLSYEQLARIYRAFSDSPMGYKDESRHNEKWLQLATELWLAHHSVDLNAVDEFMIDDYRVEVQPLYTSAIYHNDVWGYLLRVHESEYKLSHFVVILQDDGTYTLPELPESIDGGILVSGDLDNDGKPEVAYPHTDAHASNSYFVGSIVIVEFEGEKLEYDTGVGYQQGPQEESHNWWFINLDENDDLELVVNQRLYTVNWDCDFVQTRIYDWDVNGDLREESSQNVYPDTFNCLVLQAEQALWVHEYQKALLLYEEAFMQETVNELHMPYVEIRMGLATILAGETERAKDIFDAIATSDDDFAKAVSASYTHDPRPLSVCQAVYKFLFEQERYYSSSISLTGAVDFYDGGFLDVIQPSFHLENATCNLPYLLDEQLENMTFTIDETPLEQIQELGLKVADFIEVDLDLDGVNEWLIWIDAPGLEALFFVPMNDGYYRLSRPSGLLQQPNEYNIHDIMTLPNNEQQVIVALDFSRYADDLVRCAMAGCGGGGGYVDCLYGDTANLPQVPGNLFMWRMQNSELQYFFQSLMCEFSDIEVFFNEDNSELHAGYETSAPDYMAVAIPVTYEWDEILNTYVLQAEFEQTSTVVVPTPTVIAPTPLPYSSQQPRFTISGFSFFQLRTAFVERDYEGVLAIFDIAYANPDNQEEYMDEFENPFRYYRALSLEALNRHDEALVEYVIIYEDDPDSAWGQLAQLHLIKQIAPN